MALYQAIVLAVVQALTEFLPVSSTAHLILFPWLLGWPDPGEAFDVALHAGTLLAVILYFFKDWVTLAICGLGGSYPSGASAEEVASTGNCSGTWWWGRFPARSWASCLTNRLKSICGCRRLLAFR